eukprot:TRINITY_DN1489_c0_g1_i10.p1 TRINITY_DN1489_c0_g1~~TRINITY_DN1489_c0_g1_i10.p1  ORF type:complete len:483 (+),score=138.13 TRINITY_DN1489_c0_g1_i10:73-1449(+)
MAAGVGLLAWGYTAARRPALPDFDRSERLNFKEQELAPLLLGMQITTATLLSPEAAGSAPCPEALQRKVRERVVRVIKENPWLAGEVRKLNGQHHLTWRTEVSTADAEELFHACPEDTELGPVLVKAASASEGAEGVAAPSYSKACEATDIRYTVTPKANGCKPLFSVWLAQAGGAGVGRPWVLIVSMDHGVADGATYYHIRNMLSEDAELRPLDPRRVLLENSPVMTKWFARGAVKEDQRGVMLRAVMSLLQTQVEKVTRLFRKPAGRSSGVFSVNPEAVEREKARAVAAAKGSVGFVSTNDVLTGWMFSQFQRGLRCMVINLRGRVDGVDGSLAGNYTTTMLIDPTSEEDYAPQEIRRILEGGNDKPQQPVSLGRVLREPFTMVSNWSTFHRPLCVAGYSESIHLPIIRLWNLWNIGIIFRLNSSRVGMALDHDYFAAFTPKYGEGEILQHQVMSA